MTTLDWWKDHGFEVFLVFILALAIGLMVFATSRSIETPEDKRSIYEAWCRAHKTEAIKFEEWDLLRRKKLLPGQSAEVGR